MKTKILLWPAAALLGLSSLSAQAVPIDLYNYSLSVDGITSYIPANVDVDVSLFDDSTGLGTITATFTGAGSHSFDAIFDHDIGAVNKYNEKGVAKGVAAAGQSWEIDDPSLGDIYNNFDLSMLDNSIDTVFGNLSMAMGWDFTLSPYQTATITLLLDDEKPDADFYLKQKNIVGGKHPYSNYNLYLSGSMIKVPEPSILLLMGLGLAGMAVSRRKQRV